MNNKRTLIWLGSILLLSAAFLLLNFRIAASSNRTEKLLLTTDMGNNLPVAMRQHDKISVVLVGQGPLVEALQKALAKKMEAAALGEIEFLRELDPDYPNPVLIVKVGQPGPVWTPLFALSSKVPVHAGYASDGDTTFMESNEKTHTSIGKPDVANMYAEYDIIDFSVGLISRPGYHYYLADYLAEQIVAALKDLYNG